MNGIFISCSPALFVVVAFLCSQTTAVRAASPSVTAEPVTPPLPHTTQVHSVAFSPTGRQVATGDEEGAYLWDAASGKLITELKNADHVQGMAYSPDGKLLLTGGHAQEGRLWNTENGEPYGKALRHGALIYAVAYNGDYDSLYLESSSATR